ncbi:thioesterase family protein [Xylariales sp. PMI_506]|nr:thioesterase family protein [Xylariales sp. PMI_506]
MALDKDVMGEQMALEQITPNTYTASYHPDWTLGPTLHGGCVAAVIHRAATVHLATTLASQNQPDILNMHFEFLRGCETAQITVAVEELRLGAGTSTIQLRLSQNDELKVLAIATSINFDKSVGPSVPITWNPNPPLKPTPDFQRIQAQKPDDHWLPIQFRTEKGLGTLIERFSLLLPREGFPVDGSCDTWFTWLHGQRMDATYLTLMTDCVPSMPDTLLHNSTAYDIRHRHDEAKQFAEKNPGATAELHNTLKDVLRAEVINFTVTLNIEFKRRLPKEGVQWIFNRANTRMYDSGRLDIDITICDENMELLCLAHQTNLSLDTKRKFKKKSPQSAL